LIAEASGGITGATNKLGVNTMHHISQGAVSADQHATATKQTETNCEHKTRSYKINNLTVNVNSRFYPKKNLSDIMFSIASARLKEKSE
jgi:hypothetical protein